MSITEEHVFLIGLSNVTLVLFYYSLERGDVHFQQRFIYSAIRLRVRDFYVMVRRSRAKKTFESCSIACCNYLTCGVNMRIVLRVLYVFFLLLFY